MKISSLALLTLALLPYIKPAYAATAEPPPDESAATQALLASPRHGEWADLALPGSDAKLHTWVVYPERKDKAPVVIVIHEIFGMTDWIRAVADRLAGEGFIAVAPDLLSGKGPGGGGTESFHGDDVRSAIMKLAPNEVAQRLDAARKYGLGLPSATARTGSIGFCWGGGASFAYATHQPALDTAVVFYGTPPSHEAMASINCPVYGFYGGDDARVTSTVEKTVRTMTDLNKSYRAQIFPGAGHGFLRQQSSRDGANLKAARLSWAAAVTFLKQKLETAGKTKSSTQARKATRSVPVALACH